MEGDNRGDASMMILVSSTNNQARRLYLASKKLRGAETKTEIARLLNVPPQNLNVWEEHGIPAEGLLKAQELIGCDAIWLRDGTGEMVGSAENRKTSIEELTELVALFGKADKDRRRMILTAARVAIEVQERN